MIDWVILRIFDLHLFCKHETWNNRTSHLEVEISILYPSGLRKWPDITTQTKTKVDRGKLFFDIICKQSSFQIGCSSCKCDRYEYDCCFCL